MDPRIPHGLIIQSCGERGPASWYYKHWHFGKPVAVFAFSPLALMRPPVESIVIPVRPDPAMPSSSVVIGLCLLIAKTLLPHGTRDGTATANVYDGQPPLTAIP